MRKAADSEAATEALTQLARGQARRQAGELQSAVDCYRQAVALDPARIEAHILLGRALRAVGDHPSALVAFDAAVACDPARVEAHNGRGLTMQAMGRLGEAVAAFECAVALGPERESARFNLALALAAMGEAERAAAELRVLLSAHPDDAEVRVALAGQLRRSGDGPQAVALLEGEAPSGPVLHELGAALAAVGRADQAIAALERAMARPSHPPAARYDLGVLLRGEARLAESEAALRGYLALVPDDGAGHQALGSTLKAQGRVDEAVACYREALRREPTRASAHSDLLLALHYRELCSEAEIGREHRRWAECHAPPLPDRPSRPPLCGRRMRVAYLSADLRAHAVAYFIEPLLAAHDRSRVVLHGYSATRYGDAVTERLRGRFDSWREVADLSDEALAAAIETDGIDVLIELGGHTGGSRLGAVARRPAPLQVSYLGYPNTTGLGAVDLRITDALADPPDAPWHGSERLVRIAGGMLCYQPSVDASAVSPPPSAGGAPFTFGCCGAMPKLSPPLCEAWAQLLARCPGSRLLLKNPSLSDEATADRLRARFADRGVGPERLWLRGFVPGERAHLDSYADIDVALDTSPYAGTTTTCEALWMGVPVVSLRGDWHAGRMGASLLGQLGLGALVADSPSEYLQLAEAIAADADRLGELRRTLRSRMKASSLCDGPRLAGALEELFAAELRAR